MSTVSSSSPNPFGRRCSCVPPVESAAQVNTQLVEETKRQIRELVQEISRLSQSEVEPGEFYEGFLSRVVQALAAVGGAVWTARRKQRAASASPTRSTCSKTGLVESKEKQARHGRLLKRILNSGESQLVAPHSGAAEDDEAGNPTDLLLVVGTLRVDQEVVGLVEVFQRATGGPSTQRGYLRFLRQMCDLASDYLKNRRLRLFGDKQLLWEQLEQFTRRVHQSLDPTITALTLANEGRRLLGCDRVSVAIGRKHKQRLEAISGCEQVERRSRSVRRLEELIAAAIATGEPFWYRGDSDELPPQLEEAVQKYIDQSHARTVGIVPLLPPREEAEDEDQTKISRKQRNKKPVPVGALVIEQLQDGRLPAAANERTEVVAQHGAVAVGNAVALRDIPLLSLWKALGKTKVLVLPRNLPKSLGVAGALAVFVAALLLWPAELKLESRGVLQPQHRREVFAALDGLIVSVPTEHGQQVERDQVLAEMRNTDLEVAIADVLGELTSTEEQIRSIERALLDDGRRSQEDQTQLSGQLLELRTTRESLARQVELYREKQKQLFIRSPLAGQVVTWQVRENLLQRTVQRGQALMTIVDPNSPWELELEVPENRAGRVAHAWQNRGEDDVPVTFLLATHPGEEFEGRVVDVHRTADVGEEGNTVLVRVAIDRDQLPELRPGVTVTAQVHCGKRPLGFVWFHDVIDLVQSKILFRL